MTNDWNKLWSFQEYIKARKLEDYVPPHARNNQSMKAWIKQQHVNTIEKLELRYPDFRETYDAMRNRRDG